MNQWANEPIRLFLEFGPLIDNIEADPAPQEETVKDLTVDTDGETATVSFNYEYHSNGVMTNYGR